MFFDEAPQDAPQSLLSWKFALDNPTPLGWTIVAAYLAASVCCVRVALKSRDRSRQSGALIWWMFAGGLAFLGVNKQLNLQTLMIVVGRNISNAGGWYGERRRVQFIFAVVFGVFSFVALIWFWRQFGNFFRENHLVLAGAATLVLFVIMRAVSINHAFAFRVFRFTDNEWTWVLEILGSQLIGLGALLRASGKSAE